MKFVVISVLKSLHRRLCETPTQTILEGNFLLQDQFSSDHSMKGAVLRLQSVSVKSIITVLKFKQAS